MVNALPTPPETPALWVIDGLDFTTTAQTEFKQEYGFFGVGVYVEVRYVLNETNTAVVREIETHVAPGNGLIDRTGILTSFNSQDEWDNWVIDEVTYRADPAIQVDSGSEALQPGQLVLFNSYRIGDQSYITQIRSQNTAVDTIIYLPIVTR